jgi:hypothetical protein
MRTYKATGDKYNYSVGDRGNKVYNVQANDSEIVFSNWLSDEEAVWLEQLFISSEVFLLDGIVELPIVVDDTNVTIGEKENRGLISYSINFTNAYNKIIQRQ